MRTSACATLDHVQSPLPTRSYGAEWTEWRVSHPPCVDRSVDAARMSACATSDHAQVALPHKIIRSGSGPEWRVSHPPCVDRSVDAARMSACAASDHADVALPHKIIRSGSDLSGEVSHPPCVDRSVDAARMSACAASDTRTSPLPHTGLAANAGPAGGAQPGQELAQLACVFDNAGEASQRVRLAGAARTAAAPIHSMSLETSFTARARSPRPRKSMASGPARKAPVASRCDPAAGQRARRTAAGVRTDVGPPSTRWASGSANTLAHRPFGWLGIEADH